MDNINVLIVARKIEQDSELIKINLKKQNKLEY